MTKLILVRHGQTDWNRDKRIQGQLDIPLSADGKKQIHGILSGLANLKGVRRIAALYSSELSRSVETAENIANIFKLRINKLKELNELNQGVWQGLLESQIQTRYKKLYAIWKATPLATRPPKGESIADAEERVISAIKKIIARHKNQAVCVVTHEIISAIIKCHYKKVDLNKIWDHIPKNATLEVIEVKGG